VGEDEKVQGWNVVTVVTAAWMNLMSHTLTND
jgi:hypothetical protein